MDYNPPGSSAHGILQARITEVGCHSLLQGIFESQGWNLSLLHCRQILYYLSNQGSPREGTKDPWLCLITTLLLLSLLWLFSFVSAYLTSLIKLILWLMFSTDKRQAEDKRQRQCWGKDHRVLLRFSLSCKPRRPDTAPRSLPVFKVWGWGLLAQQLTLLASDGRWEVQEGGDIHILMADSCWCMAETNSVVKQLSSN